MRSPSNKNDKFKILYATSLSWQLGFLIIIPLGGFLLLGIWLDKILGTKPFFLALGIVSGISISGYGAYRSFLPLIKKSTKKLTHKTRR